MIADLNNSKKPVTEKAPPNDKGSAEASPQDKAAAQANVEPAGASNHSRGEGQKPVSQAYKDNWSAIYGKNKRR